MQPSPEKQDYPGHENPNSRIFEVETVSRAHRPSLTPLKRGANEMVSIRSQQAYGIPGLENGKSPIANRRFRSEAVSRAHRPSLPPLKRGANEMVSIRSQQAYGIPGLENGKSPIANRRFLNDRAGQRRDYLSALDRKSTRL